MTYNLSVLVAGLDKQFREFKILASDALEGKREGDKNRQFMDQLVILETG